MRTDARRKITEQAMRVALETIEEGRLSYIDAVDLIRCLTTLHRVVHLHLEKARKEINWPQEKLVPPYEIFSEFVTTAKKIAEGKHKWEEQI